MEEKNFNEAKRIKELIEKLYTRSFKLQEAMSGTMRKITIEYVTGEERQRPGKIYLNDAAGIKDLMQKEYTEIKIEIDQLKEKFKNL
jgi:division protein CdvB (Snf7/Vps24/ESCRT-III family)